MGVNDLYWPYSGFTDYGDCWCSSLYDDNGNLTGVRVEKADPRVLISAKLLASFHQHMEFGSLKCAGSTCPVGDVFRIDGINQRVIYVVTRPDERWLEGNAHPNAYIAEWPD